MRNQYTKVAVIGRPNVGKSTLFNRLLKERKSIVDDLPGVTRDRLYADMEWNGKGITFIDTGGLVYEDDDQIYNAVRDQVYLAINEADYILFMVDGQSGITSTDEKITRELRKIKNNKKVFLAVNKIDTEKQLHLINDFYSLGLGEPHAISAISGSSGLADILDEISQSSQSTVTNEDVIKIAIVGKPNVGKSSILNCLLGKERSIVTDIPGTTRDTIDTEVKVNGKDYTLIDTAGLRKKSKVSSKVERYSTSRTVTAIERADVVLLVVDVQSTISEQDQKIAALIKRKEKPTVVIVNKWDLIEHKTSSVMNDIEKDVIESLQFIDYSKILFTSALTKKNLIKVWDLINEAYANSEKRVPTSKLNKVLEEIVLLSSPPTNRTGKKLRIYYVTQASVKPPEIVFFVNDTRLLKKEYERFLERGIRDQFDFTGTPIRLTFRNKKEEGD